MDFGLHEMLMAAAIGLPWVLIPGGLVGVDWWLRGRYGQWHPMHG